MNKKIMFVEENYWEICELVCSSKLAVFLINGHVLSMNWHYL
jgi:hypothetical protein